MQAKNKIILFRRNENIIIIFLYQYCLNRNYMKNKYQEVQ